jgi:diguanylate cyclase (GGDEF)-like protein/PAS domain S-box-containing protein
MHVQAARESGDTGTLVLPEDLFEVATIGMAVIDLRGRILRANAAFCELVERSAADVVGASWTDLTHPDDIEATQAQIEALLSRSSRHVDFEKRYLRSDGSIVVAHVSADVMTVGGEDVLLSQVRDVSNEYEALAEVWSAQRRLRSLAESSDDVVWVQRIGDGGFTFVSDSLHELTGYEPGELYADPALAERLVHPEDRRLHAELLGGPDRTRGALLRWQHRDGTTIWVEQRVSEVPGGRDRSAELVCVVHDVTDRVLGDMARARHDAQHRAVTAIAQSCIALHDHEAVLDQTVQAMAQLVPADLAAVWWEVEPDGPFRLVAGHGFELPRVGALADAERSHPARVRSTDQVTTLQRRSLLDDWSGDEVLEVEDVRSGIGIPIRSGGRVVGVVASYRRGDGQWEPEDVTFLQAVATTIGACADRARFDELLTVQSLHDPTTGLPNRIVLLEHLGRALDAASDEQTVVVATCDLDDFQLFNEAMGHDFGDSLLAAFAQRLSDRIPGALIARSGGDEVTCVVVCPLGDPRIDTIGSEISAAMRGAFVIGGHEVTATCSVGISIATEPGAVDDVLATALVAMNQAKGRGRGLWMYSSGDEQARAVRQLDLTTAFRRAVADGGVAAYFQPIVDLRSGTITAFEALARWVAPDGRFVSPTEFVPLAESNGLAAPLGLTMLEQSCELLARLRDLGIPAPVRVSVNVSPSQLDDPEFPRDVAETLWRHGVAPGSICLELTESALVPDDQVLIERLHVLKRLGVRLAIDDFGTGYSSFAYLTQFPIDVLKLDRALVTELHDDQRRLAVAGSIIGLASTLDISVVAEGVETEAERAALAELGCALGQGFLWSRAVPLARAIAVLR